MEQAVKENQTVGLTANCILIRRDGSEFAIEDSAAPIHDRGGRVTGAVIVCIGRWPPHEACRQAQAWIDAGLPPIACFRKHLGTGYSSLSYLRQFPIDTLKIDQSFVREITAGSLDDTIVGAVISMGKTLKQRVVAEGVETGEQLAFLQRQHCGEGQGFHFSRPVSAEEFGSLLKTGKKFIPH